MEENTRIKRSSLAVLAVSLILLSALLVGPARADIRESHGSTEYVSIGDSYVAAGSIANITGGMRCTSATDNVGHLVARRLNLRNFNDAACSGADTKDILWATKRSAAQVNAVAHDTRYISVSIGGNDEGLFNGLIEACVVRATCTKGVERTALRKVGRLPAKLDGLYRAIHTKAPDARVVVVGYFRITPSSPLGCFLGPLVGRDGVATVNRVQRRLNEVIGDAARRAGFAFVNGWSDGSNSICARDGRRYVSLTGIGPRDSGTPLHPTLAGRLYSARLIANALVDGQDG